MNDMAKALVAAGVKLPSQNQRIWQWLKDNGPHTVKDVASELKIGEATVQAVITVMVQRKMLVKIERVNHLNVRLRNNYEAQGKTFVLLPPPPKRGDAGRAAAAAKRMAIPPEVVDTPMSFSPETLLATCTLAELRGVYAFLKGMFK
jgi:DNA-binding Lrp family transcriptional regulator